MVNPTAPRLSLLLRLPRNPATFYAISDMASIRRIGGVLWVFGGLIVALLLPVAPPTDHIGDWGWAIGASAVLACFAAAVPLFRWPSRVSGNLLFAQGFLAVALLTLVVWVGGEPYSELYVLPVVYAGAAHPPRRVALLLVAVAAGLAAPLFYDGWSGDLAASDLAKLLLWSALGVIAMLFTGTVRLQRLELMAGEQEASRLARRDPLTKLGNRRAFDESLARIAAGARRSDRPLSLAIADIRDFKSVNDTYGHIEGDRCLSEVAAVLATTVRPSDSCFRWGGDEFAVILPGTDPDQAGAVMRRVINAVGADITPPGDEPLGLRYGVAEITDGMSAEDLVAAADLALMAARSTG